MNYNALLEIAKRAALEAGQEILKIYQTTDFGIESKSDNSPLTLADKNAHLAIVQVLEETGLPVLSEEGRTIPYEERKDWKAFWMIDPLDGTKEFIKRNGEFTVNIALIVDNQPVLGIVHSPVLDKLYYGGSAIEQSYLIVDGKVTSLRKKQSIELKQLKAKVPTRIVASRSHRNQETEAFINECASPEIVSMGSSLKFMILAEGNADIYPRFAPTMEWDTAAADGVMRGLGYNVFQVDENKPTKEFVQYNKEYLLNPYFIAY